ncbi:trichodiene oxygenase [Aspergillus udagawae]|uniref:Trichodiene oxygenase n=1 Tax=Aspergillus udagawae TaxID=91492 RepID=A0A8H3XPJ2_9EURO|nr:uncharacterized protein Aud_003876 [Aspergillus udagawae]GFF55322.1 trichodiene oxygenase [Aspergillus udagawae]GIC87492.1 hypothetical protein Aud_003876 [Aspergillus udagawae]
MLGFTGLDLLSLSAALFGSYLLCLGIWRLYFHPLAGFPGPKLAALTLWYECYFDVFLGGQYFKEIDRLHSIYGPIVRISPHELHVKDPEWYSELYPPGNRKRDKYPWFLSEGTNATSSATVHHHVHRQRRSTLSPSFSKQSILSHEATLIEPAISSMCGSLDEYARQGTPVVLGTVFASLTVDVVLQIWFGASPGQTRRWDFFPSWTEMLPPLLGGSHFLRHFPQAFLLFGLLPSSVVKGRPDFAFIFNLQESSANLASSAMRSEKPSVLRTLRSSALPASEKSEDRLSAEGFSFVMAATESTAQTLASTLYHLVDNPPILQELRAQLEKLLEENQGQLSWTALEQLPYLRHIVMEGMRVTSSVTGRLARIAPDEVLQYKDWTIPPGTPVSMDHHFTHLDPSIFPNPRRFDPDRWDAAAAAGTPLDRYLLPFGRGSRMCIGINLASAVIYRALAALVLRYDMELFETTREDVDIVRDNLMGAVKAGSKGVRMKLSERKGNGLKLDNP